MRMGLCSIKYYKYTSVSFAICECLRELRECGHEAIRGITIIRRGDMRMNCDDWRDNYMTIQFFRDEI